MKLGFRLLCVSDRNATRGKNLIDAVEELTRAGLRGIQLREKDLPDDEFRRIALILQKKVNIMPVKIFLNSRPDLAREMGVGLHLPEGNDIAGARTKLGPNAIIGASCHSAESARAAESSGASFVVFGPVFDPISKSAAGQSFGIDGLTKVVKLVNIPVIAIGGITPRNAASCMSAGAEAVAAVGSLLSADDPQSSLVNFMKALGRL